VLPETVGLYDRVTPREHLRYFGESTLMTGGEGVEFSLSLGAIGLILVVALPLILMINGPEIAICIFARNFK